jgi:membrane-associated phospholipid phosphatase
MKVLAILVWPSGMAAIACIAALLAQRAPGARSIAAGKTVRARGTLSGRWLARATGGSVASPWAPAAVRFAAIVVSGALLVYGVMALLGVLVVHNGLTIDRPIYNWTIAHRMHLWVRLMRRLTKVGDTWTTWGAAVAAAACLAASWRRSRWLPPLALGALVVVDHLVILALRHTFHRLGPPGSPLGTYPSGGCGRVVVFYGLIAYLLWREHSGQRRTAIWAAAAVVALAFNEGYSRAYLTLHWFTDILSGWIYGGLELVVFIVAVRFVAGPAIVSDTRSGPGRAGARPPEEVSEPTGYVPA